MKIGFIAGKSQKSFECLKERASLRGHTVDHIPLRDMPLSYEGVKEFVLDCREKYDVLHYYAGLADPIGVMFGSICDDFGINILNNRSHITPFAHNKMFQMLAFSKAGLSVPKTEFSRHPIFSSLVDKLGTKTIIAKKVRGTHGNHVHEIKNQIELEQITEPSDYLFQEFIPHKNDIRVLVLDGVARCGYHRVPEAGDFRANLARGGHARPITNDEERVVVYGLAEKAVKAVPHDLAGVDIIKSETDGKYRLIEINTNPSWYGIFESTNMQFEDALLDRYESMQG